MSVSSPHFCFVRALLVLDCKYRLLYRTALYSCSCYCSVLLYRSCSRDVTGRMCTEQSSCSRLVACQFSLFCAVQTWFSGVKDLGHAAAVWNVVVGGVLTAESGDANTPPSESVVRTKLLSIVLKMTAAGGDVVF